MTSKLIQWYEQLDPMGRPIENSRSGETPKSNSRLFPVRDVAVIIASASFTPERRFESTKEELAFDEEFKRFFGPGGQQDAA